jgi:hypothetical protein
VSLIRPYIRSTLVAVAIGTVITTAHAIVAGTDVWSALRELPLIAALLLPLATFVGGVRATRDVGPLRKPAQLLSVAVGASVVALIISGFIAPWLAQTLGNLIPHGTAASPAYTVLEWGTEYRRLVAERAQGQPMLEWMIPVAGINFYQPFVTAVLTAIVTMLGFIVGERTRDMHSARLALAHQWGIGLTVLASVTISASFAVTLAVEHGIAPAQAVSLIPVSPALLLIALLWAGSIAFHVERQPVTAAA